MIAFPDLMTDSRIAIEYEKAYWLKQFRALYDHMSKDLTFKAYIMQLYRESHDSDETTKIIIQRELGLSVDDNYACIISRWIRASLMKKNSRDSIPLSVKTKLYEAQKGKCAICGCELGKDWSKIHVDHIVPWELVGDELEENYQNLCEKCNEEKNASTDYIFLKMIGLK